jgi:hypothetical protein
LSEEEDNNTNEKEEVSINHFKRIKEAASHSALSKDNYKFGSTDKDKKDEDNNNSS